MLKVNVQVDLFLINFSDGKTSQISSFGIQAIPWTTEKVFLKKEGSCAYSL